MSWNLNCAKFHLSDVPQFNATWSVVFILRPFQLTRKSVTQNIVPSSRGITLHKGVRYLYGINEEYNFPLSPVVVGAIVAAIVW
jgi:hypothetical protein